jgi:hypothetical protein
MQSVAEYAEFPFAFFALLHSERISLLQADLKIALTTPSLVCLSIHFLGGTLNVLRRRHVFHLLT